MGNRRGAKPHRLIVSLEVKSDQRQERLPQRRDLDRSPRSLHEPSKLWFAPLLDDLVAALNGGLRCPRDTEVNQVASQRMLVAYAWIHSASQSELPCAASTSPRAQLRLTSGSSIKPANVKP